MRLTLISLFIARCVLGQDLAYSPAQILEKNISLTYYSTEYIFITNTSNQTMSLAFERVSTDLPLEWSATGCSNVICYTKIPDDGPLGTLQPGEQAYMSINLSVNETAGDGTIQFAVFEEANPQNRDTISFIYHAEENLSEQEPQAWVQVNFAQNILTVFLQNAAVVTSLSIFDVRGNRIVYMKLEEITSLSLVAFPAGMYVVVVRDETGRERTQKLVKT